MTGHPPEGTADVWWARRQDASAGHVALLDETERRRWTAYRRDADLIRPGHGDPWTEGVAEAVRRAKAAGRS